MHLVLRERLDTKRRLAEVERDDDAVGAQVRDHLEQHRHEAEGGVRRPAVRRGHRGRQRVKRTVDQAVAVDDGDRALGHL